MRKPNWMQLCRVFCLAGISLLLTTPCVVAQQDIYEGATVTGTAVAFSGRAGRSSTFRLVIRKYTSAAEVQRLNEILRSGQQELLDAISGMSAGQIQLGSGIGVPANVIFAEPAGNGETRIRVFYQRNIRFSELRYGTRSSDYRFGYAELFIRRNGTGEGTLIPAAKIRLRGDNTWEVEDFGIYPARLMGLVVRGGKVPR